MLNQKTVVITKKDQIKNLNDNTPIMWKGIDGTIMIGIFASCDCGTPCFSNGATVKGIKDVTLTKKLQEAESVDIQEITLDPETGECSCL